MVLLVSVACDFDTAFAKVQKHAIDQFDSLYLRDGVTYRYGVAEIRSPQLRLGVLYIGCAKTEPENDVHAVAAGLQRLHRLVLGLQSGADVNAAAEQQSESA